MRFADGLIDCLRRFVYPGEKVFLKTARKKDFFGVHQLFGPQEVAVAVIDAWVSHD